MIKRKFYKWLMYFVFVLTFFTPAFAHGKSACNSGQTQCTDSNYPSLYWCCPSDYPVCGKINQQGNGECYKSSASTTTSVSGSGTTTTISSGGAGSYIAAINVKGEDNVTTESSGTLPGASPSEVMPLMVYEGSGRPVPLIIKDRFFPPLDKGLYEKTLEAIRDRKNLAESPITTYAIGDEKQFWVKDDNDIVWRQVTATNKKEGAHSLIFVDNTLNIADSTLETYVSEFEIMYNIIFDNIGNFSDRDGNGKIIIFIYDINDSASVQKGWLAGYFWSKDYIDDSVTKPQGFRSNEADMIYIRGDEPAGWTAAYGDFSELTLTTLIHEYQHLVHFCVTYWQPQLAGKTGNNDDIWINEMMSMASETMYFKKKLADNPSYTHDGMAPEGYLEDRILYYNNDLKNSIRNGHGLAYWDKNGDVLANYSLSYLFGQYLAIQSQNGQGVFKNILDYMLANNTFNYNAVVGVAREKISGITSWEDLIKSWATANMLNSATGLYGYKRAFTLTPHGPTSSMVNIHNGGVAYRKVDSCPTKPADAGPDVNYFCFSSSNTPPSTTVAPTTSVPPGQTTSTSVPSTQTTTTSGGSTTTTTAVNETITTTVSSNCSPEHPVDCTEQGFSGCCTEEYPYCGRTKCYKSQPICPMVLIFDGDEETINTLRRFRDRVLYKTSAGRASSDLYYRHAPELISIMLAQPDVREAARKVITDMLPAIEASLEGKAVTIDRAAGIVINNLFDRFAQEAKPELRETIQALQSEFNNGMLLKELGLTPLK